MRSQKAGQQADQKSGPPMCVMASMVTFINCLRKVWEWSKGFNCQQQLSVLCQERVLLAPHLGTTCIPSTGAYSCNSFLIGKHAELHHSYTKNLVVKHISFIRRISLNRTLICEKDKQQELESRKWELRVPQKPAEQLMVVVKANPKQGRATAKSYFSYLRSSYLLVYMIDMNHAPFVEDMLAIPNRWSLNAWSLHLNTRSCCQACTFSCTTW